MMATPAPVAAAKPFAYHCPECKAENFPVAVLNQMQPLQYSVAKQVAELPTLRSIVCCSKCGVVLAVQFLPVDVQLVGEAQPRIVS
jgi:hypothetical protein